MWILPKNYPLSSHFAQDMVASKEDLSLPGLNIESSLLVKSKPTRLRTWQTRWKQGSYYQHLFGRILKPSQYSLFETKLACLHLAIPANLLAQQEKEKEQTTPDTCGLTSGDTLNQLDLFSASSRMLKDTSVSDSERSLATWKASVTKQRGEYSQRVKSALLTREKESTYLPTPSATQYGSNQGGASGRTGKVRHSLDSMARHNLWPTPSAHEARLGYQDRSDPTKKGTQESLLTVIVNRQGGRERCTGHLNPEFVEWLMGYEIGSTELGSWGTQSYPGQPQKHG